jgi:hypothetical protein
MLSRGREECSLFITVLIDITSLHAVIVGYLASGYALLQLFTENALLDAALVWYPGQSRSLGREACSKTQD